MNPIALTLLKHHIESLKTKHAYGRPQTLSVDYVIDRIVYVLRTGSQWSNIPVDNGSWKTIYHYFSKWSKVTEELTAQRAYEFVGRLYNYQHQLPSRYGAVEFCCETR